MVAVAEQYRGLLEGMRPGELLVGGGEPTVRLPAKPGRGGRNLQLALLMARELASGPPARFVAMASDGDDGVSDAAGAQVDHETWDAMQRRDDPAAALDAADAHPVLASVGALLHTGPSGTNLLDLHLLQRLQ